MRVLLIFILINFTLFAKIDKLSPIPLPYNIYIDTDAKECGSYCLQRLYQEGKIFTILAKLNSDFFKGSFSEDVKEAIKEIKLNSSKYQKVALLFSSKVIGRYAVTTTNALVSYLIESGDNFDVKVFDIPNESRLEMNEAIRKIKNQKYDCVIAPVTKRGARVIDSLDTAGLTIFIPTVRNEMGNSDKRNIFYGGIDYDRQIDALLKFANEKVVTFDDGGEVSRALNEKVKQKAANVVYSATISDTKVDFKRLIKRNRYLEDSSIFLNTPLVTSSLIAAQITYYKKRPYSLLSTQINYHPMLLTLTQQRDRNKMFVANSIIEPSFKLREIGENLGITFAYDWINYSTALGSDFILSKKLNKEPIYNSMMHHNQLEYDVQIFAPKSSSFKRVY
jgi:ABC-type branched-subunit amino acid transport system substrate-binding protein